jgi:nicotinate-nucleotide pyrophosphorylase (carboxylating)
LLNQFLAEDIIKIAIKEDINYGDITSDILIDENSKSEAIITAKEEGVIAGISVAEMVFKVIDESIIFIPIKKDGEEVARGESIAKIAGNTRSILKGERVALNLIQRMSGIATKSRSYAQLVQGMPVRIVDTRKTTPGLRALEKYAVRVGGCYNHRFNLSDAVLIKDNHIKAVGSITKAVEKCREQVPHTVKIEVEVENLEQLKEAIKAKADIVMLDNMDKETMKKAVEINNESLILEASGNMSIEKVKEIAEIGIHIISVGALTHSVKAMDLSLNIID